MYSTSFLISEEQREVIRERCHILRLDSMVEYLRCLIDVDCRHTGKLDKALKAAAVRLRKEHIGTPDPDA